MNNSAAYSQRSNLFEEYRLVEKERARIMLIRKKYHECSSRIHCKLFWIIMNKNKNFYNHKIIEITGISAIGKTTYIKDHLSDNNVHTNLSSFLNPKSGFMLQRFFFASF